MRIHVHYQRLQQKKKGVKFLNASLLILSSRLKSIFVVTVVTEASLVNTYVLTVRDGYSRYCAVEHLKRKSDAAEEPINWIKKTGKYFPNRGVTRLLPSVRTMELCLLTWFCMCFSREKRLKHTSNDGVLHQFSERYHRTW